MSMMKVLNGTLGRDHLDRLVRDCAAIDDRIASGGRDRPFEPKRDILAEAPTPEARRLYETLNDEHIANRLGARMGTDKIDANAPATLAETLRASFDVLGD